MQKGKSDHWIDAKIEARENSARPNSSSSGRSSRRRRKSLTILAKKLPKLRFDAFVLKYFFTSHGTRGIARQHLRSFVLSVQHLSEVHPRVDVFRKLAGIPPLVVEEGGTEP